MKNKPSTVTPISRRLSVVAALLLASVPQARASFETPAASVQSAAMGGAALARPGDMTAMFLNPAAAAGLANTEAYFMYNQLYTGMAGAGNISQGFGSIAAPTKLGVVGAGFSDFQGAGLLEERVVGVSFSRRLFGSVDAGVTGKYLYHRYLIGGDALAASDPVFRNGTSRGAFALDFGLAAPLTDALTAGFSVRNLNQPDVGLASEDRVPRQFQASLAYEFAPHSLRLTADYTYQQTISDAFMDRNLPGIGLEKRFVNDQVKFRAGVTPDRFSAGIGVAFGAAEFDYTFLLVRTLVSSSAGTHMVGIRYRFGDAAQTASRSH